MDKLMQVRVTLTESIAWGDRVELFLMLARGPRCDGFGQHPRRGRPSSFSWTRETAAVLPSLHPTSAQRRRDRRPRSQLVHPRAWTVWWALSWQNESRL